MVDYFDDYVTRQRLRLRLNCEITDVARTDEGWALSASGARC
jgi:predicted NAD/FAD-dependent oxidoreductase